MNTQINARVLSPSQAGDPTGDFYYELNGVRSTNSYATRTAANQALNRAVARLLDLN